MTAIVRDDLYDDPKVPLFLTELTALSKKYGIVISGCGCCGSPTLVPFDKESDGLGEYGEYPHGHYVYQDSKGGAVGGCDLGWSNEQV